MITAITALLSVLLGCVVVIVIQLSVIAWRLGDLVAHGMTRTSLLQDVAANTKPHLPPELP
jgi:hypothetical protein